MKRDLAAALTLILTGVLPGGLQGAEVLPRGSGVEARLTVATGSRISHPGDAVQAIVIAPVFTDGRLLIPQGATLSGKIGNVDRLGFGLKHLTSSIDYRFETLRLPGGTTVPFEARVTQVETAKEQVNQRGTISGIYPTMNVSSGVAYYVLPLLCIEPHFGLPFMGVKVAIARSPDPEIYFPAGTEMLLQLTSDTAIPVTAASQERIAPLAAVDRADIHSMLAKLPRQQTDWQRHHASDLVNVLFLGKRESINRAFEAAGWSGAQRHSMMAVYGMYHCMVQRMGNRTAPMGRLTLNGFRADAEYQKSLDTFSKRHHLRLWRQGTQDIWASAATEDVDYKFRRMHLTHASDPLIDNERAKVVNDLALTGCVESASLVPRESSERGDDRNPSIWTDGKVAALRISDCQNPRATDSALAAARSGGRKRWAQALIALRNDMIRTNPVSLAFNTTRLIRDHREWAANRESQKLYATEAGIRARWRRPSVLDTTDTVLTQR